MQLLLVLITQAFPHVAAVLDLVKDLSKPNGLALDTRSRRLYWTEAGSMKLRSANLNGSDLQDVVVKDNVQDAPHALAVDGLQKKVYWTNRCCNIFRANLDGTDEEALAKTEYGGGIVLDSLAGRMYWTDWMHGSILQANLNDSVAQVLLQTQWSSPVDIILHESEKGTYLYWSDIGLGKIERVNVLGGPVEVLNVSWATMQTYGITIDPTAGKLYLTDYEHKGVDYIGRIGRTSLNGDDFEVLASEPGMQMPFKIVLDTQTEILYWTDQRSGKIQRLALKCPAGLVKVRSRNNDTNVFVPHQDGDHGRTISALCPQGYNGSVTLACNDGQLTMTSGQCGRRCISGDLAPVPVLVNQDIDIGLDSPQVDTSYPDLDDGEVITSSCPEGSVGTASLKCQDGNVILMIDNCRKPRPCDAGQMMVGSALISYDSMTHGLMDGGACPFGFDGYYFVKCEDGTVEQVDNATCRATCVTGTVWVDNGAVEVPHGSIKEGGSVRVLCPAGSAGDGVALQCVGGYINITEGGCKATFACNAGVFTDRGIDVTLGQRLDEGVMTSVSCPSAYAGTLNVTCVRGQARVTGGSCFASCKEGWAFDAANVPVRYSAAPHGSAIVADCPIGFSGKIPFVCQDGNVSLVCDGNVPCACTVDAQESGSTSGVPVAVLAAVITAAVFSIIVTLGLVRYRMRHRRPADAGPKMPSGSQSPFAMMVKATSGSTLEATSGFDGIFDGVSTASSTCRANSKRRACRDDDLPEEVLIGSPVPVPLYWATRDGVQIFSDPNRIVEVQQLMTETWRACFTRDRRLIGGDGRVPVGCRVANVLRVENHKAYSRYWNYKDELSKVREGRCEPFTTLTSSRINLLDDDVNERYLFHGTNPEAAHAIARDFFHIDKAGSCAGSMFGRGIYLAENASKSDEYAKEGGGVYVGLCAMLLCRAVLGEVHTVSSSGDQEEMVRSGRCDSVCGDRLAAAGTFRELVFFDEEAVYTEFIVIYARIYGDD